MNCLRLIIFAFPALVLMACSSSPKTNPSRVKIVETGEIKLMDACKNRGAVYGVSVFDTTAAYGELKQRAARVKANVVVSRFVVSNIQVPIFGHGNRVQGRAYYCPKQTFRALIPADLAL